MCVSRNRTIGLKRPLIISRPDAAGRVLAWRGWRANGWTAAGGRTWHRQAGLGQGDGVEVHGVKFIPIGNSKVLSQWAGKADSTMAAILTVAWQQAPCVVFFDEVEKLLQSTACLAQPTRTRMSPTSLKAQADHPGASAAGHHPALSNTAQRYAPSLIIPRLRCPLLGQVLFYAATRTRQRQGTSAPLFTTKKQVCAAC